MTENVPEADPKYAEVAEVIIGVPKDFTNFMIV